MSTKRYPEELRGLKAKLKCVRATPEKGAQPTLPSSTGEVRGGRPRTAGAQRALSLRRHASPSERLLRLEGQPGQRLLPKLHQASLESGSVYGCRKIAPDICTLGKSCGKHHVYGLSSEKA